MQVIVLSLLSVKFNYLFDVTLLKEWDKRFIRIARIWWCPGSILGNPRSAHYGRSAAAVGIRLSSHIAVARVLNLQKEKACLAAPASIPRVLQLSVRRSRGEAIGRIKRIGTPNRLFYTGMPPRLLGGSGPKTVCILR